MSRFPERLGWPVRVIFVLVLSAAAFQDRFTSLPVWRIVADLSPFSLFSLPTSLLALETLISQLGALVSPNSESFTLPYYPDFWHDIHQYIRA